MYMSIKWTVCNARHTMCISRRTKGKAEIGKQERKRRSGKRRGSVGVRAGQRKWRGRDRRRKLKR